MCWISTDRRGRFLLSAAYDASLVAVSPIGDDGVGGPRSRLSAPSRTPTRCRSIRRTASPSPPASAATWFASSASTPDAAASTTTSRRPGTAGRRRTPSLRLPSEAAVRLPAQRARRQRRGALVRRRCRPARLGAERERTARRAKVDKPWAADLHLRPDGRFLYASERRSSTLAGFAVDPASGRLAPIGSVASESEPRGFAISPDGRLLIAVGQASHRLGRYAIDPATGALAQARRPAGRAGAELGRDRRPSRLSPGTPKRAPGPLLIALAGMVALAVAMGIGRFAFTPILPMMLHDGVVDLVTRELAGQRQLPRISRRRAAVCAPALALGAAAAARRRGDGDGRAPASRRPALLTLAMALPLAAGWPLWRFAAGVASAVVLVYTTGWCLGAAGDAWPRRRWAASCSPAPAPASSSAASSPARMVAADARSEPAWLVFGVLAVALSACDLAGPARGRSAGNAARRPLAPRRASRRDGGRAAAGSRAEIACFALAYGLAGFGYIVTATFLPVIARAALPGSPAARSVLADLRRRRRGRRAAARRRLRVGGDLRLLLAAAYVIQALGIGIGIVIPDRGRLRDRQPAARPALHRPSPSSRCRRRGACARTRAASTIGPAHGDVRHRPDRRPADGVAAARRAAPKRAPAFACRWRSRRPRCWPAPGSTC